MHRPFLPGSWSLWRRLGGFRLVGFLVVPGLLMLACNLPILVQHSSTASATPAAAVRSELDQVMTLEKALATRLDDNRPQVLDQMGPPDTFQITFELLNGVPVRQEEWSYQDDAARFDFVNGALVWTLDLEPVTSLSVNAALYDPLSFEAGMTPEDVRSLLQDQELLLVDLSDTAAPSAQVLAGDQILLGFEAGRLVYVRTFELVQKEAP